MSVPVIDRTGVELGSSPVMVFLAHRHALQHDCWVLMEDGALMLGLRHLAECVHGPETRRAHLDRLDGSAL